MALKQDNWNGSNANKIYIDYKVTEWPTEDSPYFLDRENNIQSKNTKGFLKGAYWAKTVGKHTVRSITFVIVDEDWDEQHINGSLVQGTKDVFNALLANIGKDVAVWIYLNKNKYPSGSVRDGKGNFVEDTFFPYNAIDLEGMWNEIVNNYGYFLKEGKNERKFVEALNKPQTEIAQPEIEIEDVPF